MLYLIIGFIYRFSVRRGKVVARFGKKIFSVWCC